MISVSTNFKNAEIAQSRQVGAKVELYNNSTLVATYTQSNIVSVEIQRVAESNKFFGQVVTQRVNFKLLDVNRSISISAGQKAKVFLGYKVSYALYEYINYPTFYITEVNRDDSSGQLSITGYDFTNYFSDLPITELNLSTTETLQTIINKAASYYGTTATFRGLGGDGTDTTQINTNIFDAKTSIKQLLAYIAEYTGTVAFVDYQNVLVFKRMCPTDTKRKSFTESNCVSLNEKTNRRLVAIASVNGETTVTAQTSGISGTCQDIISNPIFVAQNNLQTVLNNLLSHIGTITSAQFELEAFGFLELEIGDKVSVGNYTNYTFILDDVITYNGVLREKTKFIFEDNTTNSVDAYSITDYLKHKNEVVNEQIIEATNKINGAKGGAISLLDLDNDGNPDNIFLTNVAITKDDLVQDSGQWVLNTGTGVTSVIRMNYNGIGIDSGANCGTSASLYKTAITGSGIIADRITTGKISSTNGKTYFDLDNSILKTYVDNSYSTVLTNGKIDLYRTENGTEVKMGGLVGMIDSQYGNYIPALYYTDENNGGRSTDSVRVCYGDVGNLTSIAEFNKNNTKITANNIYLTGNTYHFGSIHSNDVIVGEGDRFSSVISRRTIGNLVYEAKCGAGTCTDRNGNARKCVGVALEEKGETENANVARIDIITEKDWGGAQVAIRGTTKVGGTDTYSKWLELGSSLWFNGDLISNGSTESMKKEIEEAEINATDIINDSVIYKYRYNEESNSMPIKYGLIIERECPKEIINNSGEAINLYSMASISWKAIQEMDKKIKRLENRIKELEAKEGELNE